MTKGERIKFKREQLNIGQTELANQIGISKQTLYKYENDIVTNIPSDVIEKLSFRLGCEPAYIMGWDSDNTQTEVDKAIELYEKYKNSIPEVQAAVEALLKSSRPDP